MTMGGGPVSPKPTTDLQSQNDPLSPDSIPAQPACRLLYSKSKVYVHASVQGKDQIPGFVCIVQQDHHILFAYITEAKATESQRDWDSFIRVEADADGFVSAHEWTDEESIMIAPVEPSSPDHSFAVPITSLYSLVVRPPTLASWHGTITPNVLGGDSLPTLYFHDDESRSTVLHRDTLAAQVRSTSTYPPPRKLAPSWGGEDVVQRLKIYANVIRSSIEPSLYLINPSRTDLEVHTTAVFDDFPEIPAPPVRQGPNGHGHRTRRHQRNSILHESLDATNSPPLPGLAMDPLTFSIFNSFSKITRNVRSTAQMVLSHPIAKPILPLLPEPITNLAHASPELTLYQGGMEYDSARIYLAKWARVLSEEGERARKAEAALRGNTTWAQEDSSLGSFEVLAKTYNIDRPKCTRATSQPIYVEEWHAWFLDGKLQLTAEEARKRIFQRGLAPEVRKFAWPFLLGVYPWDSSAEQRTEITEKNNTEYDRLRKVWADDPEVRSTDRYAEEFHRIDIDCRRTDRLHPMYASSVDPMQESGEAGNQAGSNANVQKLQEVLLTYNFWEDELGYVQGMSDLCSPLYVVNEADEAMTFWCFVGLMERTKPNFFRDQSGMKEQLSLLQQLILLMDPELYAHLDKADSLNLFFCFRWCLVLFKREFDFDQVLRLWEVMFTDWYGKRFHLFVCMSILSSQRDVIIRYLMACDEILKFVNDLSGTMEVDPILDQAEILALTFRAIVDSQDKGANETIDGRTDLIRTLKEALV